MAASAIYHDKRLNDWRDPGQTLNTGESRLRRITVVSLESASKNFMAGLYARSIEFKERVVWGRFCLRAMEVKPISTESDAQHLDKWLGERPLAPGVQKRACSIVPSNATTLLLSARSRGYELPVQRLIKDCSGRRQ